ncbi:AMP-binding protein [Desulfotruncus alcoholivorax]|uniref:AMP-binding protein n=1 Tax=Desulfotruncus alcoholivorax TaxID=265477 RepID=UPI00041B61E3|nr:AMP-binding protein [Desulfotruncus alcoholivorax]
MHSNKFPPNPTLKEGFFSRSVYEEAINRYPTVVELVKKKAKENKDKTWLIFEDGRSFTYEDIDILSDSLAGGFYELGVRENDKVAIYAYNSPEWIFSYFGILKTGAIPVTVNTGFIKDPLIYNLSASNSKFLIIDYRLLKAYKDVEIELNNIDTVIIIGNGNISYGHLPIKPYVYFDDVMAKQSSTKLEIMKYAKDPCAMILTSGTTGPSKVVVDANAQFISTALFMADAGGVTEDSTVYVYLPLFHIMALDLATISSMLANARMILVEKFTASSFWHDIKKYDVTHFHAVGPILEMLFKNPPSPLEKDHGQLVAIAYCSKEVWSLAKERFNISITGGYGSTEVGIPVSSPYNLVISGHNPPGSCGRVGPHVEVKVMDDNGRILPSGQIGEIVVRPGMPWTIFLEYYEMPKQTVEAFKGLWFHTGDAGYFDEQGYLYFVDRVKDAIRRKGENISSYEVEQVLLKNPDVVEAAVVPAPSEVGEDEVMAVIATKPGEEVSLENIFNFCLENMPSFWVPRYIRIVKGLPRTPTGRIEKFKLRNEGVTEDTYDMKNYIRK